MSTDTTTDASADTGTTAVEPSAAETPETPEGSPEAGTDAEVDQDDVEDQDDDAGDGSNREAARYRRRLRSAEAERDALKATVESLQRAEVDRLATDAGLRPAALWANGAEVGELLGDDGTVDQVKVAAAIAAARETLGIAPPPPPRGNFVKREGASVGRPPRPSGKDAMVAVVQGRDGSDG